MKNHEQEIRQPPSNQAAKPMGFATAGRYEDFIALRDAAVRAIAEALADGERGGKHGPGSWMQETIEEQLRHIEAHVTAHVTAHQCGDRNEDHLAHIVCRAAIAMALREREQAPPSPVSKNEGGNRQE